MSAYWLLFSSKQVNLNQQCALQVNVPRKKLFSKAKFAFLFFWFHLRILLISNLSRALVLFLAKYF